MPEDIDEDELKEEVLDTLSDAIENIHDERKNFFVLDEDLEAKIDQAQELLADVERELS